MIKSLGDLLNAIDHAQLSRGSWGFNAKLRVYLNGRYMIEKVTISKDDGAIVLWLDERGDQEQ